MSPDPKVELVPFEDRRREQIAAQLWLRRSALAMISEAPQEEPKELPAYLSVPEAIGLIGFGRLRALSGPVPGAPAMYDRWRVHVTGASPYERQYPLVHRMRLVLARVRWWMVQKREREDSVSCPIAALRPDDRAEVRWAIRKHGLSSVRTIALLRADVRNLLAATDTFASAIDQAIEYLCADIAAERLVAWGRAGDYRKGTFCGMHEGIPPQFFANRHATLLRNGWATCNPKAPVSEWANWRGPDWGDVRFKQDELISMIARLGASAENGIQRPIKRIAVVQAKEGEGRAKVLRRADLVAIRQGRITRFRERQRNVCEWVCFADIADWCARASGDILPDEKRRSIAYAELSKSLLAGEFEVAGRSRVLFLNSETSMAKMTRDGMSRICRAFDQSTVQSVYLASCWFPRDTCIKWMQSKRLNVPPWLMPKCPMLVTSSEVPPSEGVVPEDLGNAAGAGVRKAPPAPGRDLRIWYENRVRDWPSAALLPSEAQDWEDAKNAFPEHQVARDTVRALRRKLAPSKWTAHGRRKLARK